MIQTNSRHTGRFIWHVTLVLLPLLAIPVMTVGILVGWNLIDDYLNTRDVAKFIEDHQDLVEERLKNPNVHSFSLSHSPEQSGRLLIQFEVHDKATYKLLELDLIEVQKLRFLPNWNTEVRSHEKIREGPEPGIDLGYAAEGVGIAGEAIAQSMVATFMSVIISFVPLILAFRTVWRNSPDKN